MNKDDSVPPKSGYAAGERWATPTHDGMESTHAFRTANSEAHGEIDVKRNVQLHTLTALSNAQSPAVFKNITHRRTDSLAHSIKSESMSPRSIPAVAGDNRRATVGKISKKVPKHKSARHRQDKITHIFEAQAREQAERPRTLMARWVDDRNGDADYFEYVDAHRLVHNPVPGSFSESRSGWETVCAVKTISSRDGNWKVCYKATDKQTDDVL